MPDPSGGCFEWQEEFLCTETVSRAGSPVGTPTVETGSDRDESSCETLSNSFSAVSGAANGSVHRFDFPSPTESSWVQITNTTYLHLGEVKIWGLNAAGQTVEITEVHRDQLVASQKDLWSAELTANKAVDGNPNTFNHTRNATPWLKISFPDGYRLTRIDLHNRHNTQGTRLNGAIVSYEKNGSCLLYTSPSPRD